RVGRGERHRRRAARSPPARTRGGFDSLAVGRAARGPTGWSGMDTLGIVAAGVAIGMIAANFGNHLIYFLHDRYAQHRLEHRAVREMANDYYNRIRNRDSSESDREPASAIGFRNE